MPSVLARDSRANRPASRPAQASIHVSQLPDLLSSKPGAQPVTIVARTAPKLAKSNPFFNRLQKVSKVNGFVGWQYESSVNRQREREGVSVPFTAAPRKWGRRIDGTPLVEHNGTLYVELKVERVLHTQYLVDGRPMSREELADFLPEHGGESSRQGVDREVVLRDYKLASIQEVTLGGQTFSVVHDAPLTKSA